MRDPASFSGLQAVSGGARTVLCGLLVWVGSLPQEVQAQSATPGALEEVVVTGRRSAAADRLAVSAGGTAMISREHMPASANQTMARVLADVPGVVVQEMQSGFAIGERCLRPAMVGVAKSE